MTRQEKHEEKLKKEKELIDSIKGQKIDGKQKAEFRKTEIWKNFRKLFDGKIDYITQKKLPKKYNLHHMRLDSRFYTDLNEDNFEPMLNSVHDFIHWLYGYYRKDKSILDRIKDILDKMVSLNDGKDVKDFLKD